MFNYYRLSDNQWLKLLANGSLELMLSKTQILTANGARGAMELFSIRPLANTALALTFACSLFAFPQESAALELSLHQNHSSRLNAVLAEGDIVAGDFSKVSQFISSLPEKENSVVYLSSNGGSLYEGILLGLFFNENRIKTVVEGGESCFSACAIAFLGGTARDGRPWRSSSDNSKLGYHSFYEGTGTTLSSGDTQRVVADLLLYAQEVNAPIEIMIMSFLTPSTEIYVLSNEEVCDLGVKLWSNATNRFIC